MFSFGDRILPEYDTRDVALSNITRDVALSNITHDVALSNRMARQMKLRCMPNKVFLVNHWRDILNCSYKWLCFSNIGA